jgi:ABC-type iron transport system FetAB permease component
MEAELDDKMGKSKNRSRWTLRILLGIYAILYLIIGSEDFLSINAPNSWDIEYSALKILFAIFVIGYVISWKFELASGVIFILWFLGMCYENFFLCTSDCGAGIAMGIPLLILSIFFIVYGIREKR